MGNSNGKAVKSAAQPAALKKPFLPKLANFFGVCAELSNVGIFIEILAKWFSLFSALARTGLVSHLILFADPLIYFFRALKEVTRIASFKDLKKINKAQVAASLVSLAFFSLAITFFLGAILAPPIGITVAWAMGLCGLCPISYFDYFKPARLAKEHHEKLVNEHAPADETKAALDDFKAKQKSKRLYIALLIGLALLLICGSAAAFAPPLLVPILAITSKAASIYLGTIAVARFTGWFATTRLCKYLKENIINAYHKVRDFVKHICTRSHHKIEPNPMPAPIPTIKHIILAKDDFEVGLSSPAIPVSNIAQITRPRSASLPNNHYQFFPAASKKSANSPQIDVEAKVANESPSP